MMMIVERVENVKKLWSLLLPSCPAPGDCQLGRWVSRFSGPEIEYAIGRTAVKFRNGMPSDSAIVQRYSTGILINEQSTKVVPREAPAVKIL
jgi:hypothetical protein